MADYEYACGHTSRELATPLLGMRTPSAQQRARRLDCPDCYRAQREAAREEATRDLDLPDLEGSERQVAWAQEIRARFAARIPAEHAQRDELLTHVRAQTSARWWIEHRDDLAAVGGQ